MTNKKLIYGVGINDADYVIRPTIDGKTSGCKIYDTWHDMLKRCYRLDHLEKKPTYAGCYVDKEWHSFMSFKAWMTKQEYTRKQLDKDLLVLGNKIYSSNTCVFISKALNLFMLESGASKGHLPTGVSSNGKGFRARCSNPFLKVQKYLGTFKTPEEAHQAWKQYKHELALQYAKLETDPRIIAALSTRYLV